MFNVHAQSCTHTNKATSIDRSKCLSKSVECGQFQNELHSKYFKMMWKLKLINKLIWNAAIIDFDFFLFHRKKKTTTTWNLQVLSMKWCFRFHSFRYDFIENHWKTYSFSFSSYLHVPVKHLPNNNNWFEKIWREKHEVLLGIWNG